MNILMSTYIRVFISLVGPLETEKSNFFTIGSKLETFNQNLTKLTFLPALAAILRYYAKRNW